MENVHQQAKNYTCYCCGESVSIDTSIRVNVSSTRQQQEQQINAMQSYTYGWPVTTAGVGQPPSQRRACFNCK